MNPDGSPNLLSGRAPATDLQLATTDASDLRFRRAAPVWSFFQNNEEIFTGDLVPDSVVALDYNRDWTVADFPLEDGAFTSYDKVAKPFDLRLRLTKGGTEEQRRAFAAFMETIGDSMELFDVVTPLRTYLGVTITRIGYQQTATNGVGLIMLEVGLREIRVTASSAMSYKAVKDPGSADPTNGGMVQPQPATPAVAAAVKAALARAKIIAQGGHSNDGLAFSD